MTMLATIRGGVVVRFFLFYLFCMYLLIYSCCLRMVVYISPSVFSVIRSNTTMAKKKPQTGEFCEKKILRKRVKLLFV